jgi:hypothetical protein
MHSVGYHDGCGLPRVAQWAPASSPLARRWPTGGAYQPIETQREKHSMGDMGHLGHLFAPKGPGFENACRRAAGR